MELIPGLGNPCKDLTIVEVLAWWISTRECGDACLREYHNWNKYFIAWCTRRDLQYWRELDWDHLQMYANELARRGMSKETIRKYTFTARSASEKAAKKWRDVFHNFSDAYTPPKKAKGRRKQGAKKLEWIADFLLWLRTIPGGWKVLPGVALQGLCGCRVYEVLRLTWKCVDLERGIVAIVDEVKNESSERRIPVPGLVLDILLEAPRNGERVVSGFSDHSAWSNALYGRKVQKRRGQPKEFVPGFMERFELGSYIPPKDFRNTLATERRKRLWNKEVMELYLGHEGNRVIDEHYTYLDDDEKEALFRSEVVSKVDSLLVEHRKQWRGFGSNVIILGER